MKSLNRLIFTTPNMTLRYKGKFRGGYFHSSFLEIHTTENLRSYIFNCIFRSPEWLV